MQVKKKKKKEFRETSCRWLARFGSARWMHCVAVLHSAEASRNATSKSVLRLGCMFSVLITTS